MTVPCTRRIIRNPSQELTLLQLRLCALLCVLLPTAATAQAAAPLLRLGRPAWVALEPFVSVSAVRELANGDVLVSDPGDRALVSITRGGTAQRALGRTGAGPLEYQSPTFLVALQGDSTLLIDAPARRALVLSPTGAPVRTLRFPEALGVGAELVRAADRRGRLYFLAAPLAPRESKDAAVALMRWPRGGGDAEQVARVRVPQPQPVPVPLTEGFKRETGMQTLVARRIQPFTPQDDWVLAPSGRVAIVRTDPYRVDWISEDGRLAEGAANAYVPVVVTEADKRQREPSGPPFRFVYPATKPPFQIGVVLDQQERVWVQRSKLAGAPTARWDVFDGRGALVGSVDLPAMVRLLAFSRRFVYLVRTDDDGLEWLEAHEQSLERRPEE